MDEVAEAQPIVLIRILESTRVTGERAQLAVDAAQLVYTAGDDGRYRI